MSIRVLLFIILDCFILNTKIIAQVDRGSGNPIIVPIHLDTTLQFQKLEGFGTSLCWWANKIGGWDEKKIDSVLYLICSPEGLNMRLFRFNIGGGDDPTHIGKHMCAKGAMGSRAEMPGYQSANYLPYDFTKDENQRKILLKIKKIRPDAIFEAFSNSPPYWMTISGCSSGGFEGGSNLQPAFRDQFLDYLLDVVEYYKKHFGVEFRTLEPFNEPIASWWKFMGKQEGCHFSPEEQTYLIHRLYDKIQQRKLSLSISSNDDSWADMFNESMRIYQKDANVFTKIVQLNTHTYAGSTKDKDSIAALASEKGLRLWQSESGPGNLKGNSFEIDLTMAKRIIEDLHHLKAVAWIDWQVYEEDNDIWCFFKGDFKKETFSTVKNYFVRKQFSKFIEKGSTVFGKPEVPILSVLSPDHRKIVIIVVNSTEQACEYHFDFPFAVKSEKVFLTNKTNDCVELPVHNHLNTKSLSFLAEPFSVSTIILE